MLYFSVSFNQDRLELELITSDCFKNIQHIMVSYVERALLRII